MLQQLVIADSTLEALASRRSNADGVTPATRSTSSNRALALWRGVPPSLISRPCDEWSEDRLNDAWSPSWQGLPGRSVLAYRRCRVAVRDEPGLHGPANIQLPERVPMRVGLVTEHGSWPSEHGIWSLAIKVNRGGGAGALAPRTTVPVRAGNQ